jgi:FAD/FMN-containing dehydrogenase
MTTAQSTDGSAARLLDPMRGQLRGRLLLGGDPAAAEAALPWNLAYAYRPAAVVQAACAEDVALALRTAADAGLPVTVQATGHGAVPGLDGALVILTAGLDELTVHPEGWARIGAGVGWQRVLDEAQLHGRTALVGSTTDVSAVGFLTGGGLGPLSRTYGLGADHVRAFEVVTGDGVVRRASADEHPELFWGLRGSKASLGIVTAVEVDLLPLPSIYGGGVWFDGADAAAVLSAWRTWSADLPEQAGTSVAMVQLPPLPGVPEPLAGRLTVSVRFTWIGDDADGEALLAPIRASAPALLDGVSRLPTAAINAVHTDPQDPLPAHENAALLDELPEEAVQALLELAGPGSGSPQILVELRRMGGALARPPAGGSPVSHRDAAYSFFAVGVAAPEIAAYLDEHQERLVAALRPWSREGMLPNFAPSVDPARVARNHTPDALRRLQALKAEYDPAGVLTAGAVVRTA